MRLLLFVGPVILAACFRLTQQRKNAGQILIFVWIIVALLSAAIGAMLWNPSDESSRLASSVLLASPVIILGPILLGLLSKNISTAVLCVITLVVPIVSLIAAFFLLAASEQVWGM